MRKFLSYHLPAIIWAGVIFYLSSIPNLKITQSSLDLILRNLAHIFFYFILTLLLFRSLKSIQGRAFHNTAVAAFLYALSDEFHQHLVPTRQFDPLDIMLDVLGIILGVIIIKKWKKYFT